MNSLTFKAKSIKPTIIQRYGEDKLARIVEFNRDSAADRGLLYDISRVWENSYAPDIYNVFTYNENKNEHLYAVVEKDANLRKLKVKDVLGLALFKKEPEWKTNELRYLQVNPNDVFLKEKPTREHSKIGTALIKFLKEKVGKEPLELSPSKNAIQFYLKNGFRKKDGYMQWKSCFAK